MDKILAKNKKLISNKLDKLLPKDDNILTDAIRYSLLQSEAKRLRPLLMLETYKLFKKINNNVIVVACALEMIHIFSLVHDDLPAMDNDDYRRGQLTCHKKFDEATAILVGDSLILLAIEIILTKTSLTIEEKNKIILIITKAIGCKGMCLGQSLDVDFEKHNRFKDMIRAENINLYKTGYFFKICVEIGCLLGNANKLETSKLTSYSLNFGKAFQLMDDLQDEEIAKKDIEKTKKQIISLVENGKKELQYIKNSKNLISILEYCLNVI